MKKNKKPRPKLVTIFHGRQHPGGPAAGAKMTLGEPEDHSRDTAGAGSPRALGGPSWARYMV